MTTGHAGLAIRCERVRHVYTTATSTTVALDDVDLTLLPGEAVAVVGPSGCGKSTLLSLLAGLQRPTDGRVVVGRDDVGAMSIPELLRLRAGSVGVVAQNPARSLLPYATAEQNLEFARRGLPRGRRSELPTATQLLSDLGLSALAHARVHRLSGGEQQRVAVAAALATAPGVVVADEPTSQLDRQNRDAVVDLLVQAARRYGTTTVVVTHDDEAAGAFARQIRLEAGAVAADTGTSRDRVVVGDGGQIVLPERARSVLPPGTTADVVITPDGVRIVPRDEP